MLYLFVLGLFALASAAPELPVYRRTQAPPSNGTLYPGNCEWGLEGCYDEPSTGRILQYVNSDKSLTVEKCFRLCSCRVQERVLVREYSESCRDPVHW